MTKTFLINKDNEEIVLESEPLNGKMCGDCLRNIIIQTKDSNMLGNLINLKDKDGNFKNFSKILEDIKRVYITTKEEDQDKILELMVGKENINKFKVIFKYGYTYKDEV